MVWRGLLSKINQFSKIHGTSYAYRFRGRTSETFGQNYRRFSGGGGFRWKQNRSSGGSESVVYLASVWTAFQYMVGFSRPPLDDDEIKSNIKYAIGAIMENKYDEAFDILHTALRIAQTKKNESAENYVLDMLANLYYKKGDLDPAERLFTEVMRRLLSKGMPQNDPAIIDISLKLADIYALKGDHEKADLGFQFCIASAREHVIKSDENYENKWRAKPISKAMQHDAFTGIENVTDPYALYGIVLENYAQYLVIRGKAAESVEYFNRALELSHEIYGPSTAHSITMLNNYATTCLRYNAFELALKYMTAVVDRISSVPEVAEQAPGFYCNYAEALWHCDQRDKALEYAGKAVDSAKERKDDKMLDHCLHFLGQLQTDYKKKKKN